MANWKVDVTYRKSDNHYETNTHYIDDVVELKPIVENGPDPRTISKIEIKYLGNDVTTVDKIHQHVETIGGLKLPNLRVVK